MDINDNQPSAVGRSSFLEALDKLKTKARNFRADIRSRKQESATGSKSPEDEFLPAQMVVSPAVAKFKEHLNHDMPLDPQADRDVISGIEDVYYEDGSFDPGLHELKKCAEDLDLKHIEDDRQKLRRQLQAVSRKVSELVLENHPAYAAELLRVMELQENLATGGAICHNGRRKLGEAKEKFTTASLGLLANYRKRQQLIALLKSLRTIKTLQRTDIRLREMLEEEDYPGAIQLCLECQKAASTFRHYKCISELSSKLQDTLETIEESLDVALSKTCNGFDEKHYEKLQTAYKLLGKTQTAMDQLHMHFTSAIHNTAFSIVLGYVELCSGNAGNSSQKRQYLDLCRNLTPEVFTACLRDLCKALWEVMKSYHRTIQWHETHELDTSMNSSEDGTTGTVEATLNRRYIRQKLEHGLGRIWADIQQKVKIYILSTDLSHYKYDEFIHVLDIVNRLIQIGEEFCGSKSETLQDSLRKQSVNYMRNYHRASLEELHMFLENEVWELCPVKSSFSILLLQEFKFLRHQMEPPNMSTSVDSPEGSTSPERSVEPGYFVKYSEVGSPFDIQTEEEESEDVMETNGALEESGVFRSYSRDTDSDDDIPDELKQDFVDEQTGEVPIKISVPRRKRSSKSLGKTPPIITNTTLNVCRLFGKYMQMMTVLKPIAFDVIICMSQLFDYYLYSVYKFFATDSEMQEDNERSLSSKLRTTLKRIRDNLIFGEQAVHQGASSPEDRRDKVGEPHLSSLVSLNSVQDLYGLSERVVATESLIFLSEQFEFLQSHLEAMIPPAKKAFLQQFYSQTVSTTCELRKPVYRTVAARSVNFDQMLGMMSIVKWDLRDIMSLHSNYVDVVLKELEMFSSGLGHVNKKVVMPKPVNDVIWEHCIKLANRTFVEGYSSAKKCTNEGRALMLLDFQQFLMKLEKLTDLRPIPDHEYVEGFVKAYYLPETQLENWIREHKEYSTRQLIGLVTCLAHLNKKSRQRLITMIEESDRSRRM